MPTALHSPCSTSAVHPHQPASLHSHQRPRLYTTINHHSGNNCACSTHPVGMHTAGQYTPMLQHVDRFYLMQQPSTTMKKRPTWKKSNPTLPVAARLTTCTNFALFNAWCCEHPQLVYLPLEVQHFVSTSSSTATSKRYLRNRDHCCTATHQINPNGICLTLLQPQTGRTSCTQMCAQHLPPLGGKGMPHTAAMATPGDMHTTHRHNTTCQSSTVC